MSGPLAKRRFMIRPAVTRLVVTRLVTGLATRPAKISRAEIANAVTESVASIAADLVDRLAARGETVATAESLTGGLLAATIVDVPGASAVFRGGLVVYATDLKATLGGVPVDLLAERGPVDPDVAAALAAGARERCGATWGLATTGVAGPTPQDGIAVGTVFVAVAGPSTRRAGVAPRRGPPGDPRGHGSCRGRSALNRSRQRRGGRQT